MSTQTKTKPGELTAQIHHRDGCPAERIELHETRRPDNQGGGAIQVARCIDCGASSVE